MLSGNGYEACTPTESGRTMGSYRVLSDWIGFIRHPNQDPGDHSLKVTIRNFFKLYYFNILALFVVLLLIFIVQRFFKLEQIPFPSASPAKTLILVAVLSVVEEIFFRLPLRYRPFNIALPTGLLLTVIATIFIKKLHFHWPVWGYYLTLVFLAALLTYLMYLLCRYTFVNNFLRRLFTRRYAVIFYLFNIIFALLHFSNYRHFNSAAYLIAPIITLPQLLTGLNLSYLRIRHGFFWGALYHIFWNMVWFLMILNKSNPVYGLQLMVGFTLFGLLLAWALPIQFGRGKDTNQEASTEETPTEHQPAGD